MNAMPKQLPPNVLVSVDVSKGEDDAGHRIFARTTGEVMDHDDEPVILCIEENRNFDAAEHYTNAQAQLQAMAHYFRRLEAWLDVDGSGPLCDEIEERVYKLARLLPPTLMVRAFPHAPQTPQKAVENSP